MAETTAASTAAATGVKSLCMERLRNPITTPHVSRTFINAIPVTQCPILDVSRLFEIRFQTPLGRVGFFQLLRPHKYLNSISILYFHILSSCCISTKSYTCISRGNSWLNQRDFWDPSVTPAYRGFSESKLMGIRSLKTCVYYLFFSHSLCRLYQVQRCDRNTILTLYRGGLSTPSHPHNRLIHTKQVQISQVTQCPFLRSQRDWILSSRYFRQIGR